MLACKDIRKKEQHCLQGTEEAHTPSVLSFSHDTISSPMQLAWLLSFPFVPQGSLLSLS